MRQELVPVPVPVPVPVLVPVPVPVPVPELALYLSQALAKGPMQKLSYHQRHLHPRRRRTRLVVRLTTTPNNLRFSYWSKSQGKWISK